MTESLAALTPDDLRRFLADHAPGALLIEDVGHTPTVPAAAAVLGVEPDQIIKTLLFTVKSAPGESEPPLVVVISHGERRVDKARLAAHLGVGKKQVTLASAERVLAATGYPVGGVPPVGHRASLPVLLDASVLTLRERYGGLIYGGGGDDRTMLRLTVDELLRLCRPTIVALSAAVTDRL
jgi:prolyl-tRNA editing enzyme YbaK/EbsC (Cys-tRNA(Pro) deacylase)